MQCFRQREGDARCKSGCRTTGGGVRSAQMGNHDRRIQHQHRGSLPPREAGTKGYVAQGSTQRKPWKHTRTVPACSSVVARGRAGERRLPVRGTRGRRWYSVPVVEGTAHCSTCQNRSAHLGQGRPSSGEAGLVRTPASHRRAPGLWTQPGLLAPPSLQCRRQGNGSSDQVPATCVVGLDETQAPGFIPCCAL